MKPINTRQVSADSYEVDSLEEAEFIEFTRKLPVPNLTTVVRDTYACISTMTDHAIADSRIDYNV